MASLCKNRGKWEMCSCSAGQTDVVATWCDVRTSYMAGQRFEPRGRTRKRKTSCPYTERCEPTSTCVHPHPSIHPSNHPSLYRCNHPHAHSSNTPSFFLPCCGVKSFMQKVSLVTTWPWCRRGQNLDFANFSSLVFTSSISTVMCDVTLRWCFYNSAVTSRACVMSRLMVCSSTWLTSVWNKNVPEALQHPWWDEEGMPTPPAASHTCTASVNTCGRHYQLWLIHRFVTDVSSCDWQRHLWRTQPAVSL